MPFKGFIAINLFGIVFVRKDSWPLSERTINHETIHWHQIKELWFVGFYIWYVCEWFVRMLYYRNLNKAYKSIGFEKEAFNNDINLGYLNCRKRFAFLNYIK